MERVARKHAIQDAELLADRAVSEVGADGPATPEQTRADAARAWLCEYARNNQLSDFVRRETISCIAQLEAEGSAEWDE